MARKRKKLGDVLLSWGVLDDQHLKEAWIGIDNALDAVLKERKIRTPDLGGSNKTYEFGDAVVKTLLSS